MSDYQPNAGDRVLVPAIYTTDVNGSYHRVNIAGIGVAVDEVLPDTRPVDPDWWPPQANDVALRDGFAWCRSYGEGWETVGGSRADDQYMRGAELIARNGKRWPQ